MSYSLPDSSADVQGIKGGICSARGSVITALHTVAGFGRGICGSHSLPCRLCGCAWLHKVGCCNYSPSPPLAIIPVPSCCFGSL
ncbi:hypothetical protein NQZ68_035112 [Dissostichus eleginoides]|nr:hypothetical protein NQZ68_035112 [Dissostichus eleginoides]